MFFPPFTSNISTCSIITHITLFTLPVAVKRASRNIRLSADTHGKLPLFPWNITKCSSSRCNTATITTNVRRIVCVIILSHLLIVLQSFVRISILCATNRKLVFFLFFLGYVYLSCVGQYVCVI